MFSSPSRQTPCSYATYANDFSLHLHRQKAGNEECVWMMAVTSVRGTTLRIYSNLNARFSSTFCRRKWKLVTSASFISSFSLLSYHSSSKKSVSVRIFCKRARPDLKNVTFLCQVSRSLGSSLCLLTDRNGPRTGGATNSSKKLKSKLEQMKEMVRNKFLLFVN